MAGSQIQLDGAKELRKALRDYSEDNGWRGPLKEAYGSVSTLVEGGARAKAQSRSNPRMGSRAAESIAGKATTTGARIEAYKGIPYGPGHEFGSIRYRQFPGKREGGYNIYPTIDEKRAEIEEQFMSAIGDALERAFPE